MRNLGSVTLVEDYRQLNLARFLQGMVKWLDERRDHYMEQCHLN